MIIAQYLIVMEIHMVENRQKDTQMRPGTTKRDVLLSDFAHDSICALLGTLPLTFGSGSCKHRDVPKHNTSLM